jgi:hypothetical protein
MEADMKESLGVVAGGLGMLCAILHGYLGETRVIRPVKDIPAPARRVLQAVMFLSAVYWFVPGAILAASPLLTAHDRELALFIAGGIYGSAAAANFWAMRGRHFGWLLLGAAAALAWLAM